MAGRYQFDHPWWSNISETGNGILTIAKDFVRHLLVVDVKSRYTASQALAHPFIAHNRHQEIRATAPAVFDSFNKVKSRF